MQPNTGESGAQKLLQCFIDEAKRQAYYAGKRNESIADDLHCTQRLFHIHAPRGVGKTFFLNYLLSRWSDQLDQEKTFWVRVDLVKEFTPHNNVERWIYAQLAKVVFRYYNSNAHTYTDGDREYTKKIDIQEIGLEDELYRYIEVQRRMETRNELDQDFIRMRDVFSGLATEMPLGESLVNHALAQQIFYHLLKNGFSVIVILDGFDRLETTPDAIKKFQKLSREISVLASSSEAIGYTIIFVSRTSTSRHLASSTYRRIPAANTHELIPPPLEPILQRRIRYIIREVSGLAKAKNWDLHDWPDHLNNYVKFLDSSSERIDYKATLEMFGGNRRAQLQVLQLAYLDYLSSEQVRGRKNTPQYKLIEIMTKSGFAYPPLHYRYTVEQNRVQRNLGDEVGPDHIFLPSLFSYPFLSEKSNKDFRHTNCDLLCGLRILQLVKGREDCVETSEDRQLLTGQEISQLLKWLFDYDQKMVRKLLVEYVEAELLYVYNESNSIENDVGNLRIGAMPKLGYVLDEFIKDSSYLALAIMRAPIGPFDSQLDTDRMAGLVRVRRYDRHGGELIEWIVAKAINSISAYRLVRELNETQKSDYDRRSRKVSDGGRWQALKLEFEMTQPFDIAKLIRDHLIPELISLLSGTVVIDDVDVIPCETDLWNESLERYINRWT